METLEIMADEDVISTVDENPYSELIEPGTGAIIQPLIAGLLNIGDISELKGP
jgi:hypothetical protein